MLAFLRAEADKRFPGAGLPSVCQREAIDSLGFSRTSINPKISLASQNKDGVLLAIGTRASQNKDGVLLAIGTRLPWIARLPSETQIKTRGCPHRSSYEPAEPRLVLIQSLLLSNSYSFLNYYYYRSANPMPSGHRAYTQRVCSHTMGPLT